RCWRSMALRHCEGAQETFGGSVAARGAVRGGILPAALQVFETSAAPGTAVFVDGHALLPVRQVQQGGESSTAGQLPATSSMIPTTTVRIGPRGTSSTWAALLPS